MESGLFKQGKKGITFSSFSLWAIRLETFHFKIQSSCESPSMIDGLTAHILPLLKEISWRLSYLSDTERIIFIISHSCGTLE